jgi:hypothetical protein
MQHLFVTAGHATQRVARTRCPTCASTRTITTCWPQAGRILAMHRLLTALALSLVALPPATGAGGMDLHAYWESRCMYCHGHAAEFARRTLRVEGGKLVGVHHRTGESLELFLRHRYLSDDLLQPVSAMLIAQVRTPPLYSQRCVACHSTAADFARKSLAVRGGVLFSESGRKVADVLSTHGKLSPDEVPFIVDALTRVVREVESEPP